MSGKIHIQRWHSPRRIWLLAPFLALLCLLATPLSAAACGGLFSADAYTEQNAEQLIFTVDPGRVTLYEQIHYTGSPKDFAWVLPVPAVPQISTASNTLFQSLEGQTAPQFDLRYTSACPEGFAGGGYTTAAPQPSLNSVNIYSSGTTGPYSYNVIGSSNPLALTQWLNSNHYNIPAESQAEMQPYIAAHMLFLAMRLQVTTQSNALAPIKITYATTQQQIGIPLRMATPMGTERLGVLVWIFGQSRYVPQSYSSISINDNQLSTDASDPGSNYADLVDQAVNQAHGHGFVTEYAQPTSHLFTDGDTDLQQLQHNYSYLTRLYTHIAPDQITLDPTFAPQTGLPNVAANHTLDNSPLDQVCWPLVAVLGGGGLLVATVGIILCVVLIRRRRKLS